MRRDNSLLSILFFEIVWLYWIELISNQNLNITIYDLFILVFQERHVSKIAIVSAIVSKNAIVIQIMIKYSLQERFCVEGLKSYRRRD